MIKLSDFFQQLKPGSDWTLFLDRDGVINRRLVDDYVKCWDDFEFLPHVLETLNRFDKIFKHIFVVTNQQGVGKGLMTAKTLDDIHQKMVREITEAGGRIDHVFYCPDLTNSNSINRKPNIGMGLKAKKMFPDIKFREAVMIGDSLSDMQFGRRLGMKTVLIPDTPAIVNKYPKVIDFSYPDMKEFSANLPISTL
jgi:D-glycero-D-manno-heptose 1,7-bisphosphate phosphatase